MSVSKTKTGVNLLQGNIMKSLLLFSFPLLISNVFQQLYNTIDVTLVGNILGDGALAAIGASTPIYDLLVGFALGMGNGLAIVIARYYGAHKEEEFRRSVAAAMVIGAVIALVVTAAAQLGCRPLLELLDTPEEVMAESESYISTITLFTVVMVAFNLCSGILNATGNSLIPMIFLILSSGLNIGLDYLFIAAAGMGVQGAAVATVIAQGCSVVLCVIYMLRKCPEILPGREHFVLRKKMAAEMLGQGLALGFMNSIVSAGSVILQYGINGLGYLTIAAHTTARRIFLFCAMPFFSMSMAISTFTSQNKGAGQPERIRKGIRCAAVYNLTMTAVIVLILWIWAPALVAVISGSTNTQVLHNGSLYLRIVAPFFMVLGTLSNLRNALQGIGEKLLPVLSSVTECVGKILFVVLLIPKHGYYAVIFCEPVLWCVMALQLFLSFYGSDYIKSGAAPAGKPLAKGEGVS
ncbi:MAG: MATE family efflux transporter [Lachnospiraceae bacterium]|nr:MATE family efflux transporter [Lachnospiraceae bacterium]